MKNNNDIPLEYMKKIMIKSHFWKKKTFLKIDAIKYNKGINLNKEG